MTITGNTFKKLREGMCHTPELMAGVLAMPYETYREAENNGLKVSPGGFEAWRLRECLELAVRGGAYSICQQQAVKEFLDLIPV